MTKVKEIAAITTVIDNVVVSICPWNNNTSTIDKNVGKPREIVIKNRTRMIRKVADDVTRAYLYAHAKIFSNVSDMKLVASVKDDDHPRCKAANEEHMKS